MATSIGESACSTAVPPTDSTTPRAQATALVVASGGTVSATNRVSFPVSPIIQLVDANAKPVAQAGTPVTVVMASGGGTLSGGTTATTVADGTATFSNLAIAGTVGIRMLTFSSPGLTNATVTATVAAGSATTVAANGGNNQSSAAGTAVVVAPSVKVTDADGNAVSGIPVTFAVASGGGSLTGASQTTHASGIATLGSWTLGSSTGMNTVTATATGLAGSPLTFTATATVAPVTPLPLKQWRITLSPRMDSGTCTGTARTNQTFDFLNVTVDRKGEFEAVWTEGASPFTVVVAKGTVTPTTFSAVLTCGNGSGAAGSMSATWTGSQYDGAFSFQGSTGTIVVKASSFSATTYSGAFSAQRTVTVAAGPTSSCTWTTSLVGTLTMTLIVHIDGSGSSAGSVDGSALMSGTETQVGAAIAGGSPMPNCPLRFTPSDHAQIGAEQLVTGAPGNIVFNSLTTVTSGNTIVNNVVSFRGVLSGGIITGTVTVSESGNTIVPSTGSTTFTVTLR